MKNYQVDPPHSLGDVDKNTVTIFRIEHGIKGHGMWYNEKGEYSPKVLTSLSHDTLLNLDMQPDIRHQAGGLQWLTGVTDITGLLWWFSPRDIIELFDNNYRAYKMVSQQYMLEPTQVLYTMEGLVSKEEIPLESILAINTP